MSPLIISNLQRVDKIFRNMDRDKDAKLTYDEFVEGSKQDPTIVQVSIQGLTWPNLFILFVGIIAIRWSRMIMMSAFVRAGYFCLSATTDSFPQLKFPSNISCCIPGDLVVDQLTEIETKPFRTPYFNLRYGRICLPSSM